MIGLGYLRSKSERRNPRVNFRTTKKKTGITLIREDPPQQQQQQQQQSPKSFPVSSSIVFLFLAVFIAFILLLWVIVISHQNWSWNSDQDDRNKMFMDQYPTFELKDMELMAKDLVLDQNITNLNSNLQAETLNRIEKDMELMENATQIKDRLDTNREQTMAKDMEYMSNFTTAKQMFEEYRMFDIFLLDQFMILMANISSFDEQINQETQDRITKDMILMDNVTQLQSFSQDIQTLLNIVEAKIDDEILELQDKDQVLMQNFTNLRQELETQVISMRISEDELLDMRLSEANTRNMLKMDRVSSVAANVSKIFVPVLTINGEPANPTTKDFNIVGVTNVFGKRITVQTNVGMSSATLAYQPFPGQDMVYTASYLVPAIGLSSKAAIQCIRCAEPTHIGGLFIGSMGLPSLGPSPSLFSPVYPAACMPLTCVSSRVQAVDDTGNNPETFFTVGLYSSGIVRIPPGSIALAGVYSVHISLRGGFHPKNDGVSSFLQLDYGTTTTPPGVGQYATATWVPCTNDNYMGDPQPRDEAANLFHLNCRFQYFQPVTGPATWILARFRGTDNYENPFPVGNTAFRYNNGITSGNSVTDDRPIFDVTVIKLQ